jgi:hypothetical protein
LLAKHLKLPDGYGFGLYHYLIKLIKTNFGQNKFVPGQTTNVRSQPEGLN